MLSEYLTLILCIININSFLIGYLFGYKFSNNGVNHNKPKSFFDENKKSNTLSIDEKKVVVNIETDGLEKKYDSLGDTKTSDENISGSINKLKKMKN
jgi:hypothetical protein